MYVTPKLHAYSFAQESVWTINRLGVVRTSSWCVCSLGVEIDGWHRGVHIVMHGMESNQRLTAGCAKCCRVVPDTVKDRLGDGRGVFVCLCCVPEQDNCPRVDLSTFSARLLASAARDEHAPPPPLLLCSGFCILLLVFFVVVVASDGLRERGVHGVHRPGDQSNPCLGPQPLHTCLEGDTTSGLVGMDHFVSVLVFGLVLVAWPLVGVCR